MRRVAAKANVSLSTVVRHFGTKDALLAALVGQGGEDEERDELRRSMEPGDVAAAVRVVVGDYEEAGQQLMHMLAQEHRFPALSELLDLGRRGHRTWVRWAFSPQLAGRTRRRKDPARGPAGRRHGRLHVEAPPHRPSARRASDRGGDDGAVRGGRGAVSRFLLATWDGGGTIPPELGLAAELVARGHEVVVLSDDTVEQEAAEAGATFTPWQRAPQARARDAERALIRDWEVKNPLAQVRQVGELLFFGPASLHAADLSDAIDQHSPDVLIVDALLTGASAGAEHSGLPTAAVAPNVNMLRTPGVPPMGSGLRPARRSRRSAARRGAPPAQRRADGHRHAQRHASRARSRPRRLAGAEHPASGSGHLPDQRGVRLPADEPRTRRSSTAGSRSRRANGSPSRGRRRGRRTVDRRCCCR